MASFCNPECFDDSSLQYKIESLEKKCREACENEDQYAFRSALKILMRIEEQLWKYYMEVCNRR